MSRATAIRCLVRYQIEFTAFNLTTKVWKWLTYLKEDYATEQEARNEITKITSHGYVFRIKEITTTTRLIDYHQ